MYLHIIMKIFIFIIKDRKLLISKENYWTNEKYISIRTFNYK